MNDKMAGEDKIDNRGRRRFAHLQVRRKNSFTNHITTRTQYPHYALYGF